jgi:hypothetical protein
VGFTPELLLLDVLGSSSERARTYVAYISPPPESMLPPLHGRLMRARYPMLATVVALVNTAGL